MGENVCSRMADSSDNFATELVPNSMGGASVMVMGSALAFVGLIYHDMPIQLAFFLALATYIAIFHGDFWYRSYLTLHRDLSGLLLIIRVKIDCWRKLRANESIDKLWMEVVRNEPNKVAMIDIETGREYTFEQFNALINRYANLFQGMGLRSGECVAIYMENSTDFIAAWMGMAKIGVVSAWINSNLKSDPLAHCITACNARLILTTDTLQKNVSSILASNKISMDSQSILVIGDSTQFHSLHRELEGESKDEPKPFDNIDFKSVLCFIYTSGTTGLPKAAVMKHFRYYSMVAGAGMAFSISKDDRIYVAMPIYHTAAGILGVGMALINGSCCVIRRKFSASNFWKDCVKYECTASQYIGEICRYLLAQKPVPEEKVHRLKLMYGNGLRAEIWQPFVDRFRVKIGELYGSTEGTSTLVNIDGKVGACGFLPISPLTKKLHPVRLVKVDEVTGEILRREDGLCIPCNPGETGAMVSTIRKNNPLLQFEGYLNAMETTKKILRDVFSRGDSCFLSGDILHLDRLGYVYFKDRTGDTYRWKGENVSTTEVEAVVHPISSVSDATVYGVTVPGHEGRAGMVAVVKKSQSMPDEELISLVEDRLVGSLAGYALPIFIRLCSSLDRTGTFKLVKTNLQRLSFSLEVEGDRIYFFDSKLRHYTRLNAEMKKRIDDSLVSL
ncbi:hypothetical protein PENTCL1PPCAC_18288 [Pristionchus entomophagus]|uniref:Very long-chain fatty acid transport protein n=1 Tax=Pristionchus entomophagus TaxID=358040 RepID=A0AAV5TPE2_9BILA|nr:hypothetical protein PENTCL1PPCAC_18288 [Pristionchus entomophagus]